MTTWTSLSYFGSLVLECFWSFSVTNKLSWKPFFWRFSLLDVTVILRVDNDDNHFVASNLQNAIAGSLVQFWVSWWWRALSFCLWEWSSLRMTLLTWPRLAGLHLFGSTIEIKKIYKLIWVKTYNFTILTELMFSKKLKWSVYEICNGKCYKTFPIICSKKKKKRFSPLVLKK